MNVKITFSNEQREFLKEYPKTRSVLENFDLNLGKVVEGEYEGYAIGDLQNLLNIKKPEVKKFIPYFEKFLYEGTFKNKLRAYVDWDMIYLMNFLSKEFLDENSFKILSTFCEGCFVYKEFISYADDLEYKDLESFLGEFIKMQNLSIAVCSETAEILVIFKDMLQKYEALTTKEAIYMSYFSFYLDMKVEEFDSIFLDETNTQIAKLYMKRDLEENEQFIGQFDKIFDYWINEVDLFKQLNLYGNIEPDYDHAQEYQVYYVYNEDEED